MNGENAGRIEREREREGQGKVNATERESNIGVGNYVIEGANKERNAGQ